MKEIHNPYERDSQGCESAAYRTSNLTSDSNLKTKNIKKEKSDSEQTDNNEDFEIFWEQYPNKTGKAVCQKKFSSALKIATLDEILEGVENFKIYCAENSWYSPCHASTWLNQQRWQDSPEKNKIPTSVPQQKTYSQKETPKIEAEAAQEYRKAFKGVIEPKNIESLPEAVESLILKGGILYGSVGCGKTTTAKTVLASLKEKKTLTGGMMMNWLDIYKEISEKKKQETTYGFDGIKSSELIQILINTPCLIIDEIGMKPTTDAERTALYQIINGRYEKSLPTTVVTNYAPDRLKGLEGMGIQCFDRVVGQKNIVLCAWESLRAA